MSDQSTYTMYRRDSRGTIEVDLHDPVYSLDQLIEKQRVVIEDRSKQIDKWQELIDSASTRRAAEENALAQLIRVRDAAKAELEKGKHGD